MEQNLPSVTFSYLWYTNNNQDNTVELLTQQSLLSNTSITIKDWPEEHLATRRIVRLAGYREEQLQQLKKVEADYFLMIDTEVFFNGAMVGRMLESLENTNANAIAAFTVNKLGFYHDTFAHVDLYGTYMKPTENSIQTLRKRHLRSNPPVDPYPVQSAFGGLFLGEKALLDIPNLTYLTEEPACEHLVFNKTLNEAGYQIFLDNQVTPIMCGASDYQRFFDLISSNTFDLRSEILKVRRLVNIRPSEIWNELKNRYRKLTNKA